MSRFFASWPSRSTRRQKSMSSARVFGLVRARDALAADSLVAQPLLGVELVLPDA